MATTTNYGWTTPDDTALVKDGASAIRTLGTSVDTTTKNLNPQTTLGDIAYRSSTSNVNTRLGIGTTGQILTVASGVPSWATDTATGTVTLVSVVTANGFAGTVATDTTTPAITLTTSISGLLKGNATAISAAAANIDYVGITAPVVKTANFTVADGESYLINNKQRQAAQPLCQRHRAGQAAL